MKKLKPVCCLFRLLHTVHWLIRDSNPNVTSNFSIYIWFHLSYNG